MKEKHEQECRCLWCKREIFPKGFHGDPEQRTACLGIDCPGSKIALTKKEWLVLTLSGKK